MIRISTLNKEEALRYMGYKGQALDIQLTRIIDDSAKLCLDCANPAYTYNIFPVDCKDGRVYISGSDLCFESSDLTGHLSGCSECAVMCATIGAGFDRHLSALQATDPTKAFIFNSCGSALIEQVCDAVEAEILERSGKKKHSFRFSPGYGDLPLSAQLTIFRLLKPERTTGVNLTPDNLLIPVKSVTAILGLSDTGKAITADKCSFCKLKDTCVLRKGGNTCDNSGTHKE